jgi:hypothetical protein
MLGRSTDPPICTFREHSWLLRLVALWVAIMVVRSVLAPGPSRVPWLTVLLVAVGLLIPTALLVWDHQRGVHVFVDGIRSVGVSGSRFLPWSEIATFEINEYVAGSIAVFAVRHDGSCVGLGDTGRWPFQRKAVEQTRDQLNEYRKQWLTTRGSADRDAKLST